MVPRGSQELLDGDNDVGVDFDGDDDVNVHDGDDVADQEGGGTQDFTTITWQIGLGETLCYRSGSHNHHHKSCRILIFILGWNSKEYLGKKQIQMIQHTMDPD